MALHLRLPNQLLTLLIQLRLPRHPGFEPQGREGAEARAEGEGVEVEGGVDFLPNEGICWVVHCQRVDDGGEKAHYRGAFLEELIVYQQKRHRSLRIQLQDLLGLCLELEEIQGGLFVSEIPSIQKGLERPGCRVLVRVVQVYLGRAEINLLIKILLVVTLALAASHF